MEDFLSQCLTEIRRAIQAQYGGKAAYAAEAWGISPGLLSQWLSGKRKPGLDSISPIFAALNIRLETGNLSLDYDYVPKVEAKAGAGASLETSGAVSGLYAFRREFLQRIGVGTNAVMMDVVGDSMEPLIQDSDTILIDQQDIEIQEGKIYVVTLGEELRVKRVFRGLDGLILRSENKIYPDIEISASDIDRLVIHGRVRWFGRVI